MNRLLCIMRAAVRRNSVVPAGGALLLILVPGCHAGRFSETSPLPAVNTRFTNASPAGKSETRGNAERARELQLNTAMIPAKVGLAMQSSQESEHTHFASRLGIVLMRELQLSAESLTIEPLVTFQPRSEMSDLAPRSPGDVVTVAFTEPKNSLPEPLPPSPFFQSPPVPLVDQILVVRILEYRPYFPLLATLELRVLDGESQDQLFLSTATWSGEDYRLADECPPRSFHAKLFGKAQSCEPSPGHNSPQALMHLISRDVCAWYHQSLRSAACMSEPEPKHAKRRFWSLRSGSDCDTCPD